MLALRRIGAKRLEELFGPGEPKEGVLRRRVPVVRATTVAALEAQGEGVVGTLSVADRENIRKANLTACVTCTDVHEYGKILVEVVLEHLNVKIVDAGVCADPHTVVDLASSADFVAVSTYCGVALDYVQTLRREMEGSDLKVPIFVGGKLNQIPADSTSSMPVDVTSELADLGAVVCVRIEDMLAELVKMAREGSRD